MEPLRLIVDSPRNGATNMAIDAALLESAATNGIATLRLYQWSEPTLSLGYFQAADERQGHSSSIACPLVRRASGGGAILHDRELTYSLALPEKSSSAAASRGLYEWSHSTLIAVLKSLGVTSEFHSAEPVCETAHDDAQVQPFLCFQRRTCFDIVSSGAKIVGSAQRRRRGAILQHGSVLLTRSQFAPELPGIEQIAGKPIALAELIDHWPPQLTGSLGRKMVPGLLTQTELSSAEAHCRKRFAAEAWTYRR
jgi:lipoate-protein ligase A